MSIRELKARTGKIVKAIERGEEVILLKRGKPLASITGLKKDDFNSWWEELKRCFIKTPFKNADEAIAWMKGKRK